MTTSSGQVENRLGATTSPYLLQHRHNPVDWWPWSAEALAEAKRTGKPILLSTGYAACHWCHVMAHESFEDPATAAVMNELFVNIKVDREERPDIDQIYMSALHHLGQSGGWPLTMFLTSDAEPVWGGTYFPKQASYGRPAFVDVLREVARLFRDERGKVDSNRDALMERLAQRARTAAAVTIDRSELDHLAAQIADLIDPEHGGLRGAPKFPQVPIFELLWRAAERTGIARYRNLVLTTLDRMCEGGIYDHLGGGFARYSTDERWLVPHFEKMLYDNAQLIEILALAHIATGAAPFRQRIEETTAWLAREMTTPDGAFCASLDADTEGEEGKFYLWTATEIEAVLGVADAALFARHYDVSVQGNFEHRTILNRLGDLPRQAPFDEATEPRLSALRGKLLAARAERVRPGLDDKVLADWNGLTITALANAGAALARPDWVATAARAFRFINESMTRGDRLGHSWRAGRLLFPGLASDYAAMIRAALALLEATGERSYLERAIVWQTGFEQHYCNPETGGYYLTADDADALVVRPAATNDEAVPNHHALAAQNLVRLAIHSGDDRWRERADALIGGVLRGAAANLLSHAALLNAIDLRLRAAEIVVTGSGAESQALAAAALSLPFHNRTVVRAPAPDALPSAHPARLMAQREPAGAAFVCRGSTCSLPVTNPAALRQLVLDR